MRSWMGYVAAGLLVFLIVMGAADLSTRTVTCMACHPQEASFAGWMADRLKAEKKGFSHELISCAACHIEGAAQGALASRFRGLLHAAAYVVPLIDPRRPKVAGLSPRARIPSENCQYCHLGAMVRKTVRTEDLPLGLRKIGLAMDHRKHVLAREDTCARCHERYKDKDNRAADKGVNYAEVNHLACDSCHSYAAHAYRLGKMLPVSDAEFMSAREDAWRLVSANPRWMIPVPSEASCRRCHNGKIHYKTKIFEANCRDGKNYDDCAKCHPLLTRDGFEQIRRERGKFTSASGPVGSGG
jgi:hypothetical protein